MSALNSVPDPTAKIGISPNRTNMANSAAGIILEDIA
jgi:hypothetical protein